MNVFKSTSVEILSVHPLIVWFSRTIEYQLKCLGEDPNWLCWLQGLIWFEWDHWESIYNNEWHNFPLILPRTYQISIIWEKYFIQAAKIGHFTDVFLHFNGTRFHPNLIFWLFGLSPGSVRNGKVRGQRELIKYIFKVRTFFLDDPVLDVWRRGVKV